LRVAAEPAAVQPAGRWRYALPMWTFIEESLVVKVEE
jgi:hypothetical protein